ncbi:hypothetical protein Verru16b_03216 [Lacunisphaera limnophila]|uniref:Uncharacterized protein n=1 Tax=Lacunisphaera limnophila TaxID=1838286 RepID=A0A1D8AYZ9_9BACT|nr:hypothetical protein [Lacunisphaera limnophila]AOS46120.1 hypothetical protein Verru16b_03216 [Lacunisphaera limnophila]
MNEGKPVSRKARNEVEQFLGLAGSQLFFAEAALFDLQVSAQSIREHTHAERMRRKKTIYLLSELREAAFFAWDLNAEIYKKSFESKEEVLADMCARLGWNYTGPSGSSNSDQDLETGDGVDAGEVTIPRRESIPMANGPLMSLHEPSAGEKLIMKARYHLDLALKDMQTALDLDCGVMHITNQDRTEIAAIMRQVAETLQALS